MFPAGSVPWLLAHELRVAVRGVASKRSGAKSGKYAGLWRLGLIMGAAIFLCALAGVPMAIALHKLGFRATPLILLLFDAGLLVVWTLMLAQALNQATQVLYERNDLDLLLSSPLPARRVLTVRALGVAVLAGLFYAAAGSLFVIPSLFLGEFRWLGFYVVVVAMALTASAGGLLLAMGLFAVLGPKRTRLVAQVLAAVIGALVFLIAQARNFLPKAQLDAVMSRVKGLSGAGFDPHAAYAVPARALAGDAGAMLQMLAVSIIIFSLVTNVLGRRFSADAAAAAGVSSAAAPPTAQSNKGVDFRGGVMRMLVRKETRLLARDPWLISQMLLQTIYILPLGFVILKNAHNHLVGALAAGAAGATFICGQLAGNLVWVTVSTEDSPELLACAPIQAVQVLRAKLLVALTPVAVLALGPVSVIAAFDPLAGLIAAAGCALAGFSSAALNLWWSKPGERRDFRRRRSGAGLVGVVEVFVLFACGAASWLAVSRLAWAAIPAAAVVLLLLAMRRPWRLTPEA